MAKGNHANPSAKKGKGLSARKKAPGIVMRGLNRASSLRTMKRTLWFWAFVTLPVNPPLSAIEAVSGRLMKKQEQKLRGRVIGFCLKSPETAEKVLGAMPWFHPDFNAMFLAANSKQINQTDRLALVAHAKGNATRTQENRVKRLEDRMAKEISQRKALNKSMFEKKIKHKEILDKIDREIEREMRKKK